ncbi:unnamed protein product [Euphydryas editha]|uniref:Secreted protein n=1 Tax=Euphydryas editha TaxID=104508 RepID=A0AAU9U0Q7_EUPED|nr:unnamed protein product [Euphydryas editha]
MCCTIAHFIASFRFIRVFAAGATLICIRGACQRSAVVLCGREPARQAALRKRKRDPLADGLRRLHRNYPSERSCLRNVKPLSRSLFRRPLRCDIDPRDRTTYVIFGSCQWRGLHAFVLRRCIAGVMGCLGFLH